MQLTRKVIYSPFSYLNESKQTFFEDPSMIINEFADIVQNNTTLLYYNDFPDKYEILLNS